MTAPTFNAITSFDWRAAIARGRAESNEVRAQIRLAVARLRLVKLLRGRLVKL